jgi:L-serine deaminase
LHPAAIGIPLCAMRRWRSTMRELSAEARLHLHARSLSGRAGHRVHTAALYGAFAIIAAVVFGTLSVHPF